MQGKNYTNPEDRGRFGFSRSGEFRSPYKGETAFVVLLVALAVVGGLVVYFVLRGFYDKSREGMELGSGMLLILSVIVSVGFALLLVIIFGVGIRTVKKGFKCTYSANDTLFTATIGGDLHVVEYEQVADIQFRGRSSLGKIRGYDVTVKMKNGKEMEFSVCSDGYMSPQATPFYIIQERLEIIRNSRRTTPVKENTAKSNIKAITQAETERRTVGGLSAMDKMAQLLGETSNMPELTVTQSPLERAQQEVDKMMQSDGDMPSVGEKARPKPDSYFGTDGREFSLDTIQAQGVYNVTPDNKTKVIGAVITAAALAAFGPLSFYLIGMFLRMYLGFEQTAIIATCGVIMVIVTLFAYYKLATDLRGTLYNYKADGRGIYMTSKKGNMQVLFKDVISIDFNIIKLFGKDYGYRVDILTNYGPVEIRYKFPKYNNKIAKQFTPFEVIRRSVESRKTADK